MHASSRSAIKPGDSVLLDAWRQARPRSSPARRRRHSVAESYCGRPAASSRRVDDRGASALADPKAAFEWREDYGGRIFSGQRLKMTESKPKRAVHKSRWRELRRESGLGVRDRAVVYLCDRDRGQDNWASAPLRSPRPRAGRSSSSSWCRMRTSCSDTDTRLHDQGAARDAGVLSELAFLPPGTGDPSRRAGPAQVLGRQPSGHGPRRSGGAGVERAAEKISVTYHEVDAHNVVPIWVTSNKQSTRPGPSGARSQNIPQYLRPIPAPQAGL